MTARARTAVVVTTAALMLAACGGADDPTVQTGDGEEGGDGGGAIQVAMVDDNFAPSMLELRGGEEVTIATPNNGENPHSFTIDELDVDTGVLESGETAEVTFTVPHEPVTYYCTVHGAEVMSGTIEITG